MPNYKPKFPNIVDITKVNNSPLPREMDLSTDQSRYKTSKKTYGSPLTNYKGSSNPYIDYQSIDLLLSLQHPRSQGYDEMCFYIVGQVKEILYKGLHFELHNAREQIKENNINNAIIILERAICYVKYIADTWNILSTIKPEGFNEFRDYLGTASGQLSFMYRHVEFILGNKSTKMASAHKNVPHVWPEIKKSLETPSLYDETIFYLNRRGHKISKKALNRDWTETYKSENSVKDAWLSIYRKSSSKNSEYLLAETLISFDEQFSIYRWRHFTLVKKIIGYKSGTGGSSGVEWLEKVTSHHFFPELWELRNDL
tara:strand:- start:512 stop:1450 length:939 start_codon:yes stop_codon:yes gene_type:complete